MKRRSLIVGETFLLTSNQSRLRALHLPDESAAYRKKNEVCSRFESSALFSVSDITFFETSSDMNQARRNYSHPFVPNNFRNNVRSNVRNGI
jgi:hypothetical protein